MISILFHLLWLWVLVFDAYTRRLHMYKIHVFFEHRIREIIMYFVWCLKISCYIESIRKFTVYCLIVYLSAFNSIHSNLQFHNDSDMHDYVNIYTFWVVAQISKYISYTNNKQLNEAFNETLFCCTSSYALTKIQLFSILLLFVKNNENNLYELTANASKIFLRNASPCKTSWNVFNKK